MFVTPASFTSFGRRLTHDAAERLARNWTTLLLNGIVLVVAGVLIFSIDWSIRSLSTFIGALFIFEGVWAMLTVGIDNRIANFVTGVLSAAAGVAIIVWPSPSLTVLGIFVGSWLIVLGTISVSGAFAARRVLSDWWLLLLLGLAEVSLGVLALANPGATLAAIITVGGIWAVAIGAMRIVYAFELRRLPEDVDQAFADHRANGATNGATRAPGPSRTPQLRRHRRADGGFDRRHGSSEPPHIPKLRADAPSFGRPRGAPDHTTRGRRLHRFLAPIPKPRPPIDPALLKHEQERAEAGQSRIADRITAFAGSMLFVYIHIIWFGCWIGFGVESYPYGLLTMIVSLEAIFLSTFVMISQNRADAKRQVIADEQWTTVQEEDQQNKELLDLSRQILQVTKEVRGLAGRGDVRNP